MSTEYNNTFKWIVNKPTLQHILSSTQREQFVSNKFMIGNITWQIIGYHMYDTGTFHLYLRPFNVPSGWNQIIISATLYCVETICGDASIFTYNKAQLFRAQHWSPGCLSLNEIRARDPAQLTLSVNVQILEILALSSIIYQHSASALYTFPLTKQVLEWKINDSLFKEMKNSFYGKCFISFINELFCVKIFPNGYQQQGQVHIELQWFGVPITANNTLLQWKIAIPEANITCNGIHRFSYDISSVHWGFKILSTQQLKRYTSFTINCEISPAPLLLNNTSPKSTASLSPICAANNNIFNSNISYTMNNNSGQTMNENLVLQQCMYTIRKLYDEIRYVRHIANKNYECHQQCISSLRNEVFALKKQQKEMMEHMKYTRDEEKNTHSSDRMHAWFTNSVKLPQYICIMKQNGCDDLDALCELTEEDLRLMGIDKIGHRKKIYKGIMSLNMERAECNTINTMNTSPSINSTVSPMSHQSSKQQKINKILKLQRSHSYNDMEEEEENHTVPDIDDMTEEQKLKQWLHFTVKLPQYFETLMTNGYDDLEGISDVTFDELERIGVNKMGHRKKIVKYARGLKHKQNDLMMAAVTVTPRSERYHTPSNDERHNDKFLFPSSTYAHNIWSDDTYFANKVLADKL